MLRQLGEGVPELQVCRSFGLLPEQLNQLFLRASQWAEAAEMDPGSLLLCERALRRRGENAARSLAARFEALLEASPDAVLVINAMTGIIGQVNENAAALFGYSPEELVGRSVEDLVAPKYRAIHPAYRIGFLASVRKREMGYHPPIFAARADGTEVEIAVALTATASNEDVMVVCTESSRWKSRAETAQDNSERC